MPDDQWTYDYDAIAEHGGDPDDPREYEAMARVRETLRALGKRDGAQAK